MHSVYFEYVIRFRQGESLRLRSDCLQNALIGALYLRQQGVNAMYRPNPETVAAFTDVVSVRRVHTVPFMGGMRDVLED